MLEWLSPRWITPGVVVPPRIASLRRSSRKPAWWRAAPWQPMQCWRRIGCTSRAKSTLPGVCATAASKDATATRTVHAILRACTSYLHGKAQRERGLRLLSSVLTRACTFAGLLAVFLPVCSHSRGAEGAFFWSAKILVDLPDRAEVIRQMRDAGDHPGQLHLADVTR